MKKYNVMLYPYKHASKKHAQQYVGAIKNGILKHPEEMTVAQIAKAVTSGHTIILGHAEYSPEELVLMQETKKGIGAGIKHWKNQQVFAIDFDNEGKAEDGSMVRLTGDKYFSIDRALAQCRASKVPPAIVYTTGSHKEDHHKFRMIFVLDGVVDTLDRHRDVMNSLFNVFLVDGECVVDIKCCDPCRLFYPGQEVVHKNFSAVVNTSKLIETYNGIATTARRIGTRSKRSAVNSEKILYDAPEMIELIKTYRIDEIRRIIVNKLCSLGTRVFPGSEGVGLEGKKVSNIYLTVDYYFASSQKPAKPVTVRHPDDYYELTRKFPLHLLLGVPLYQNISCILPSHDDNKPSARVEQDQEGNYRYHCYGCDTYTDALGTIERLTGWSHLQAKNFMNDLLHVKFETEWQIEKKLEITEYQDFIHGKQFAERHEWLQKRLANAKVLGILDLMLSLGRLYIYDRKVAGDERPLFFMALTLLAQQAKDFGKGGMSVTTIHRKLKLLTKLGLIDIVDDKELPAKFKAELRARQNAKEQHYRINCFTIPEFSTALLDNAEKTLREMEGAGMRRKYYCREAELRANGTEAANEQYVQDANRTRSAKVEEFYIKYQDVAKKLMTKGWTTEKEILAKIKGYSSGRKQELSGICLPQLLKETNLKRVAYSKKYESQFAIKKGLFSYGTSRIIVSG